MNIEGHNIETPSSFEKKEKIIRAHEEETSELGSERFFKAELSAVVSECDSLEKAEELAIEVATQWEETLNEVSGKTVGSMVEAIAGIPRQNSIEGHISEVAKIMESETRKRFSLAELEEIERGSILDIESNIGINDLVYYRVDAEKGEISVNLHNAKSKDFKLHEVTEGLKELANEITNNPELKDIERITARSWIIEKHPKIIERYGFTLDGEDSAYISRDDFLKKFNYSGV